MCATLDYYDRYAAPYATDTADVDMSSLHDRFLAKLPTQALILDVGCGSGRDSRAFLDRGHRVHAIDPSRELARIATRRIGQPVEVVRIQDFVSRPVYDGIWACASMLHVPEAGLPHAIGRLWRALREDGVLYLSFKYGEGERSEGERHFTDATEARLRHWSAALGGLGEMECWLTEDRRPDRTQIWLNALMHREAAA